MAKIQKAEILWNVITDDGTEQQQTLRFHSVVAEEHSISTQVTQFPVQSGFNISNHAIKKNRKLGIKGLVSDYVLSTKENLYGTNTSNTRLVYGILKDLVRSGTPCIVRTNLTTYDPVIFTKLSSTQKAGSTDILEFSISGEEVIIAETATGNEPPVLVFTEVDEQEREAIVEEMAAAGIEVAPEASVSQAQGDMHQGFKIVGTNTAGQPVTITFEKTGYDSTTDSVQFNSHSDDAAVASTGVGATRMNWALLLEEDRQAAAIPGPSDLPDISSDLPINMAMVNTAMDTSAACLKDQLRGLAIDAAKDYIDTALGEAKRSAYGYIYNSMREDGEDPNPLLAAVVECVVAGAWSTQGKVSAEDYNDNPWPTQDDMVKGAQNEGNQALAGATYLTAPVTFTKIQENSPDNPFDVF